MERLDKVAFFSQVDPATHEALENAAKLPGTTHLVLYKNQDLWSSYLGACSVLAVGPGRSRDMANLGWLNDLPSRRQYPVAYWEVPPCE